MQQKESKEKNEQMKVISGGLTEICPVCGKEFACNKSFHVYAGYVGRRRKYYCSYSCFKQSKDQL
jgi:uncharacterized protein (DUF983 family)